jgi:hypothetical protein
VENEEMLNKNEYKLKKCILMFKKGHSLLKEYKKSN